MSPCYCTFTQSGLREIETWRFVEREIERVFQHTGNEVVDWLYDVANDAEIDWTSEDGSIDMESIHCDIEGAADNYIEFIKRTYPEEYCG